MKTYILKNAIYNNEEFPIGTVVEVIEFEAKNANCASFRVTEGPMKGQIGLVADGLKGFLIENTQVNRKKFIKFKKDKEDLHRQMQKLINDWDKIETIKL